MLYFILALVTTMFIWSLVTQKSYNNYYYYSNNNFKKNIIVYLVTVFLILSINYFGKYSQGWDYEIWNGEVTNKQIEKVSCEHSYACNCRQVCSTSNGQTSCSTVCDTCYEHSYDLNYVLKTNVKKDIEIERIDRQGLNIPPRYEIAQIGDPVAERNNYMNYIKATKNVYSKEEENKYLGIYVPDYPENIYDYHYLDRFLDTDKILTSNQVKEYNILISNTLKELGNKKQCNLILVLMKNMSDKRVDAILNSWLDGKKNDVIVFMGIDTNHTINKVRIISLSTKNIFQIRLRDDLLNKNIEDSKTIIETINNNIKKNFFRKSMSDFKYLEDEIELPIWSYVSIVFFLVLSCVLFFVVKF